MTLPVTPWDGQKISKPGIVSGMDMDFYHSDCCVGPSISSSGLRKIFSSSCAHYYAGSYLNPDNWEVIDGVNTFKEQPSSEPFIFGRAAHHLLLGQDDFRKHFTIEPLAYPDPKTGEDKPWSNNATFCRQWHKQAKADKLTVLKAPQVEHIRGMAKSLQNHPLIQAGIMNGKIEHSFFWQDEETGAWLKWRPDSLPTSDLDFGDLKACADVSDDAIERSIGDYGYNVQAALGAMACRAILKREMASFSLICAEKSKPYCVQVRSLSKDQYLANSASAPEPSDIEIGEQQIRAALRLFKLCLERGEWPGPGGEQSDAKTVNMKPFHRSQISYRLKAMELELLAIGETPS